MKYLTRSYVEAIGLREVAGHEFEDTTAVWVSSDAIKPEAARLTFITGVIYDERFYRKSNDGLSYDLQDAPVHFA